MASDDDRACGPVPTSIVVIFACFLSNLLFVGVSYGGGIFYDSFLETFNASRSATAWIISLQSCTLYFTGCLAGPLLARYGARAVAGLGSLVATVSLIASAFATSIYYLYATFGISLGLGFGLIYLANMVVVQQHTTRMRVLAAALSATGRASGGFILPFLIRWTTWTYGWRGCQLVLAGVVLHCLPCAMLPRSPTTSPVRADDKTATVADVTATSTPVDTVLALRKCSLPVKGTTKHTEIPSSAHGRTSNVIIFTVYFLCTVSYFFRCGALMIPYTYLPSKARVEGLSTDRASMLISVFSIGEILGRLATGFIGSSRQISPAPIFLFGTVLAGCLTMALGYCHSYTSFLAVAATCGVFFGAEAATAGTVVRDMVGLRQYAKVLGFSLALGGLGTMAATQIFARLWETTNSMGPAFVVGGAFRMCASIAMGAALALNKHAHHTKVTKVTKLSDDLRGSEGDL